ncbi:hypothetical protein ACF07S_30185 [Streptomyces sp. NPDC016640]|uniref:hypothetical protein n=1 Tax=Streptomyces sp. NPDC016640 TaxID=3364969 RepID=UPI0036F98035
MRTDHFPAVAAVLLLGVVGCSPAPPGSEGDRGARRPAVDTVPRVLDATDLPLPLDPYQFRAAETSRLARAQNVLTDTCMRRFGLRHRAPARTGSDPLRSRTERRYGLTDSVQAAESGYHLPGATTARPEGPHLTEAHLLVLLGPRPSRSGEGTASAGPGGTSGTRTYRGSPLPEGGCVGEAQRTLAGDGELGDAEPIRRINTDSVVRAKDDPRVRSVLAQWSACMEKHGHRYRDPWQAMNDKAFGGPTASPREIAVAKADVICKRRTNVVGTWYAVDAAFQRQALAAGGDRLERIKEHKREQLAAADKALAGTG